MKTKLFIFEATLKSLDGRIHYDRVIAESEQQATQMLQRTHAKTRSVIVKLEMVFA
jgi:hypothetical protein